MGIRTPDLLHAISRQPVHRSPSPQVTVLDPCTGVRARPLRLRYFRAVPAPGSSDRFGE